ncbi:hypothetical protein RND81_09G016400 [Saponaria officinalis]|uniref:Uncharacterized protein n=1 Tax=Saponaria officinalis TaxID=3572 RepID=A0AAW1IHK0_SAPOF
MEQQKGQVNNLLEDVWFFGNTMKNKSNSSKVMLRCNSDPCPSTSTKEEHHSPSKMSKNPLLRAPSLPVSLGKDTKYEVEDEEEDEDEPRMGDLIRQAMPMSMNRRRLDRTPSLPPFRGAHEGLSVGLRVDEGCSSVGKLCKKMSVESSSFLVQEKGPLAMVKLSRRGSIDSSLLLLPPKCTSKGTKSTSNSKNKTNKKLDQSKIDHSKIQSEKSKSNKSSIDIQTEELQGFNISPNVTQIIPGLNRRVSLDNSHVEITKVKRLSVSGPCRKPSSPSSGPLSVPKWADPKDSLSQDMKVQIKFWARAVASNVRQEC